MTTQLNMLPPGVFVPADPVFAPLIELCRTATIPSALTRCEETGRLDAFKLEWREGMENKPHIYWDSDVAKVLEGMAYSYRLSKDPVMLRQLNELIELVLSAQRPDGYLNSYFTQIEPENRFTNLFNHHELYCAGHLIEAAVAHFDATGSRRFLDAMCRYADLLEKTFGDEPGKRRGTPGHQELELALCKLARVTGDEKYLKLATYFLDERGREPNFFLEEAKKYPTWATRETLVNRQAHKEVREQTDAVGHAVRALYLYSGMADVAAATDDASLRGACERLFDSVVSRRMYITGGVGSTAHGEAFTTDYHLPPDSAYAESCAAVALAFFAWRMFALTGEAKYADVLERVVYNGALAGIGRSGDRFFYANVLSVDKNMYEHGHVYAERQKWFSCSCCPTTYCRFLPQLGSFAWHARGGHLRMNLPVAGLFEFAGSRLRVAGGYPWDGAIRVTVEQAAFRTLEIRIPGWCRSWTLAINGETQQATLHQGAAILTRNWQRGDIVSLNLDMKSEWVYSHPRIAAHAGRVALMRGPVVYCLESCDNPNSVHQLRVDCSVEPQVVASVWDGVPALRGRAYASSLDGSELYSTQAPEEQEVDFTAIPYSWWQNRGKSEMLVHMLRK